MKFLFTFVVLLVLVIQNQSFANSKGQKLFEEMEKAYSDMKVRSWLPTSMAGRGSKGSAFYQWVINSKNNKDIEQGMKSLNAMSASCFEVVILFSLRGPEFSSNSSLNMLNFLLLSLAIKYEILAIFSDKGDNIGKFLYIIFTFGKFFFILRISLCAFLQYEQL